MKRVLILLVLSHSNYLFAQNDVFNNYELDSIESSLYRHALYRSFKISYDTMEREINQIIESEMKPEQRKGLMKIATGLLIDLSRDGEIKRIVWNEEENAKDENEAKHRQIIIDYVYRLKYCNNVYFDSGGMERRLEETILILHIDACGKIRLQNSNHPRGYLDLSKCPF